MDMLISVTPLVCLTLPSVESLACNLPQTLKAIARTEISISPGPPSLPLSSSNPALCQAVRSFDAQEYARNWAAFAQENHFCEDGHASARCADWILARLGRKEKTP